jgi:hypothetical protein
LGPISGSRALIEAGFVRAGTQPDFIPHFPDDLLFCYARLYDGVARTANIIRVFLPPTLPRTIARPFVILPISIGVAAWAIILLTERWQR